WPSRSHARKKCVAQLVQQLHARSGLGHAVAGRAELVDDQPAEIRVVVCNENPRRARRRGRAPPAFYRAVVHGSDILGRAIVKMHPLPGRSRTLSSPPLASTLRLLIESPRPRPLRSAPCCSKGRNSCLALPGGKPPHSSSTSIRTLSLVALVRSDTCPPGWLNLQAFCSRLLSAAIRSCE